MNFEIELEIKGPDYEDYYESKSVKKGKSNYTCENCEQSIKQGEPSNVHTFYPEFQGYRTHLECSDKWLAKLKGKEELDKEPKDNDQIKIQDFLIDLIDENAFEIFESARINNNDGRMDKFIKGADIIGGMVYNPFIINYKSKLFSQIKIEVRSNKLVFNVENKSK